MKQKLGLSPDLRLGGGASAPAPAPAISLTVEGGAKAHNSTYDAGTPDEDDVVVLTVVVTNSGNAELTLVNATDSGAVSAGAWDDTGVAPTGTATFDVTLDTSVAGAQTGYFEFTSNASPSPYRVNFEFEVIALVPVMEVWNAADTVEIAHNDATPDLADGTQFATKNAADNSDRTFLIKNTGNADLTGVNVLVPSGYTLVTPPDATIAAAGSDTFVVRCNSATPGSASGNITIESTELADHVFAVACTVRTYAEKRLTLAFTQDLALSETSGLVTEDSTANNLDGAYDGVTLNATTFLDGTPAPSFDGVNDFVNAFSAGLASAFGAAAGTLDVWVKMSGANWGDATIRYFADMRIDASNRLLLIKSNSARVITAFHIGGGTTKSVTYTIPSAPADFVHIAATFASGTLRLYYNGVEVGTPATSLGTLTGALTGASIGKDTGAASFAPANIKYRGYKSSAMSAGDIAMLAVVP